MKFPKMALWGVVVVSFGTFSYLICKGRLCNTSFVKVSLSLYPLAFGKQQFYQTAVFKDYCHPYVQSTVPQNLNILRLSLLWRCTHTIYIIGGLSFFISKAMLITYATRKHMICGHVPHPHFVILKNRWKLNNCQNP